MGKRSTSGKFEKFEKVPRDFYPTPPEAVLPLIPYLNGTKRFAEPCCGDERLVRHLESHGFVCVYRGDIATGQDALASKDYGALDAIITNPPFTFKIRRALTLHFVGIAPTWLLLPTDLAINIREAPLIAMCTDVVPIGRVQWFPNSKNENSTDNFAWFRFLQGHAGGPQFHPRPASVRTKRTGKARSTPQKAVDASNSIEVTTDLEPVDAQPWVQPENTVVGTWFKIDDLLWIDFESASALDIEEAGTFRYADDVSTRAIILAYAIGSSPIHVWHADGAILNWNKAPEDLRAAFDRNMTLAAWNATFDSAVWNYGTLGFPFLAPERIIDPMVQAGVANLPAKLEDASRYLGGEGKQADGKQLIRLFCVENAAPTDHPEAWKRFLSYAHRDIEAMRDAYRKTRPLPLREWHQYWAFEHINRRGVMLDMPFVRNAAAMAAQDRVTHGQQLAELTDGIITRVTFAVRIADWLYDTLPDTAMREALVVDDPTDDDDIDADNGEHENEDKDETGEARLQKLSVERERIERVLAMLAIKKANGGLSAGEIRAHAVATIRLYGAGASPLKFASLKAQQVDGVLRGQYRFAGAYQTGRMTSRGAQIQNLARDVLGEDGVAEAPLVDAIADGCSYAELMAAAPVDVPVARKLALLARPAIIPSPKKVFVWSDWSAIEARITPWLAASYGAEGVLNIFRANDRDPSLPDIYMIAAADILHKDPNEITKPERQTGKVATTGARFRRRGPRIVSHGPHLPYPARSRRGQAHRRCLEAG
jgi:hypothetical protein